VVDNASTSESASYLASEWPEIDILPRVDGNYTAANNLGAKKAFTDGAEMVVISNMDVFYDKDWLKNLVKAALNNKEAIFQSKILLYPEDKDFAKAKINSLGNKIHYLGFGFTTAYGEEDSLNSDMEISGYPSGTSFIIGKDVFEKLEGYDEDLYMYHDDLDIGWKAHLMGVKMYLVNDSKIYHKYEFSRSIRMLYYMERNRFLVVFTYYHYFTLLAIFPFLFFHDILMWLYAFTNGWGLIKLKASFYLINPLNILKVYKKRKHWQKKRLVKDSEIIDGISGKLLFSEVGNSFLDRIANPIMDLCWQIIKIVVKFYNYEPKHNNSKL
jgi:GT2 family glycosyltransferase